MPQRLRLLTLGRSYAVGVNRRLAHEFARVGNHRWDVVCAAPAYFRGKRDLRPVSLQIRSDEPCPVESVNAYLTGQSHLSWYGARLRQLLARSWDIVHCWEEPFIMAGWQIAQWTRPASRLIVATFQNWSKRYPPPFNWLETSTLRRASAWIPFGQTVASALRDRPGYRDRPYRIIPPGVDTARFRPDRSQGAAVRDSFGWMRDGPPVVGFLGRFIPEKGLIILMNALDRLTIPWRALFVGSGPLVDDLQRWAVRHADNVRICTNVHHDDVPCYINAMDVLAAPSLTTPRWREQFGRMLIEAFACGVPIIGSDSGEIPYVVGKDGEIVAEGDEAVWAAALARMLESPSRREELATRGRERAITEFDWSVVARRHLDFFEELL